MVQVETRLLRWLLNDEREGGQVGVGADYSLELPETSSSVPSIWSRRFYPDITGLSGSDVFRQTNQDYSSVRLSGLDIRLAQTNYIQLYV